jgi:hypothetical protein
VRVSPGEESDCGDEARPVNQLHTLNCKVIC